MKLYSELPWHLTSYYSDQYIFTLASTLCQEIMLKVYISKLDNILFTHDKRIQITSSVNRIPAVGDFEPINI
jgi:hypothetical protein